MEYCGATSISRAVVVADLDDQCGECPVWDAATRSLFWTDCVGLKFNRYSAATGAAEVIRKGIEIYGFRRHISGSWLVTNPGGVWLWDGLGDPVSLLREVEGEPCALNDCCTDEQGRLIGGSFFYAPGTDYRLGHLVLVDLNGEARLLDGGFHLANGIGFSPHGDVLYAADTVARRIYAYDYDSDTAKVRNKRVFVELPAEEGLPDGLAVDEAGHVWSAIWYGGRVNRYAPDGTLSHTLTLAAKQPSSVTFGGPDLTQIYITTAGHSEEMPVMPPGYDPKSGPFGGQLFRADAGFPGLAQHPAAIKIRKGEL